MNWLSSIFSSNYSRNGQTLSSIHEAFSLPTSSPTLTPVPDVFTPTTADPNSLNYTYPPRGSPSYPLLSNPGYPPLSQTWDRIRSWLHREYPELDDTLNYGILPQDLARLELQFGFTLPPVLRESYQCVDGQEVESAAGCSEGLFFGLKFLSLEDVLQEWRFWREVDDDPMTGANPLLRQAMQSVPPGWVQREYSQRGWIPLIADKAGNYVGVDIDPDEKGSIGQVIVFGRDFDAKVVLWRGDGFTGWAKWLASFADDLETGEGIDIGPGNEGSDDSDDDVGYESYFNDVTSRSPGDGGSETRSGGGLRLSGEYRGWNVLEAWADRSLRRWREAGLTSGYNYPPLLTSNSNKEQSSESVGISFSEGSKAHCSSSDPPPITITTNDIEDISGVSSTPLDAAPILAAKLPAPRPVELPLPDDFLPIPDSPPPSVLGEDDLEACRGRDSR